MNAGFQTYLDSKDGVLSGYGIKVVTGDEANDAAKATTKAHELVEQDKAQMVIGFVNSAIAYAVAPYLEQTEVPLLVTVAGADSLTREEGGDIFRISYTSGQDAMPAGDYTCKSSATRARRSSRWTTRSAGRPRACSPRTYEDAGCQVAQEIYAPLGTQDWGPYVSQIKDNVDTVFVVAPGTDGIRLLKAYKGFGGKAPIVAHGSTTDEQLLSTQAGTADGVITSLHYTPELDTPVNNTFVQEFTDATDRAANQYAEEGYTAAMVLEAALAQLDGEVTSADLKQAIGKVSLDAPRGPLAFDKYGQAIYNVYMRKVEQVDGKWVNTPIETIPDVSQFWTYDPAEYLRSPPTTSSRDVGRLAR